MKFKNLFRFRSKTNTPDIFGTPNADEWDHPNSVYLASVVVSEYGAVLDQTAIFSIGVSEKKLPYDKGRIETAIELLLRFVSNKESWSKLKQRYPLVAEEIMTDRYYEALKTGYIELAKFLPDHEAELCERASRLLNEANNLGKTFEQIIDELRLPWFTEVVQINKRISEDTSSRLKRLHDYFGHGRFSEIAT